MSLQWRRKRFIYYPVSTRGKLQIDLYPRAQYSVSTHFHNSLGVKTARLWNLLPKRVKQNETIASFKANLRDFLEILLDTPPM